jgi:polysaccharide biosynthesis protein PslF
MGNGAFGVFSGGLFVSFGRYRVASSTNVATAKTESAGHSLAARQGFFPGSPSVGFLSTYPPTKCGLATFAASLANALESTMRVGVVRCVDHADTSVDRSKAVAEWVRDSPVSLIGAARALNRFDSVIIQHEFGLFGGRDGADIVELVGRLEVPAIVVLHTVLESPSPNQRAIVEALGRLCERVVVQSKVARERLLAAHQINSDSVLVIQHGAHANIVPQMVDPDRMRRPIILTWGLLGPGKGIEFAIDALAQLRDLEPRPLYLVLGETHPNIVRTSGEVYRESLIARAKALTIGDLVRFDDRYCETAAILAEIRKADIVLLPYLSRDQVVSGVLVEAIASGKPVVSTSFPHAVELLAEGSGIIVPHENPDAIATALRTLLTDRRTAARTAAAAARQAASLTWETVGRRYQQLTSEVTPAQALPSP